jgi:hypothetical protein
MKNACIPTAALPWGQCHGNLGQWPASWPAKSCANLDRWNLDKVPDCGEKLSLPRDHCWDGVWEEEARKGSQTISIQ